nr:hypothetical protein [Tanacetum cinerariifolium]
MSRDVITVGSTMRIPLLYRGEYSQWRERFMNYLKEQTDGEAMINSIQNDDQPLPVIAQVSLAETAQNAPLTFKDLKFWTAEEKKSRKIDHLASSLLIQGLPNDIYSLIDSNKTAKDLWDALERQMRSSEYGEQDIKTAILYEYETFKSNEGEQLLDTYLRYLQVINDLKQCGYKKDNSYVKGECLYNDRKISRNKFYSSYNVGEDDEKQKREFLLSRRNRSMLRLKIIIDHFALPVDELGISLIALEWCSLMLIHKFFKTMSLFSIRWSTISTCVVSWRTYTVFCSITFVERVWAARLPIFGFLHLFDFLVERTFFVKVSKSTSITAAAKVPA